MEKTTFNQLIVFAIERENAAAEFYRNLSEKAKDDGARVLLKELEEMENEHARVLQQFDRNEATSGFTPPAVTDLKISDFMVASAPSDNMSYQDVLTTAVKAEESSKKLYQILSERADDEATKNLFARLAHEEAQHKLQLETLYDDNIFYEF